jgi:hypothetical protein
LISFFNLFFVKFQFLQPDGLVMTDYKLVLLGVLPQPMFFQRLLDLVVSSRWLLRSSKPCVAMTFAGALFPCCLSSAFFQAPMDDELWKEEDNHNALQCNFIFFASFCVMLSFPCTVNCFH